MNSQVYSAMAKRYSAGHPGVLLRTHVLPALHLSISQAARDLGVARQTLHRILAGKAAITPDMAARLERFCGVASGFWLDRQRDHDLRHAETDIAILLARIPTRALPAETLKRMGAADGRY